MITKGFRAVIVVNVEEIVITIRSELEKKFGPISKADQVPYWHAIFIKAVEQSGLGQISLECRAKWLVNDRHLDFVYKTANLIADDVWQLFSRFPFQGWLWIDDLKIVGGHELWFCWTK